jgi:hypothetical protein
MEQILATYSLTERDGRWSVSWRGRTFEHHSKAKVVDKAVKWFTEGLHTVSKQYR